MDRLFRDLRVVALILIALTIAFAFATVADESLLDPEWTARFPYLLIAVALGYLAVRRRKELAALARRLKHK